jgi:hypothetical protein
MSSDAVGLGDDIVEVKPSTPFGSTWNPLRSAE